MKRDAMAPLERALVRRLDELGRISDDAGGLTRTFLSPAMGHAHGLVGRWMMEAGLSVSVDAVGNLIGRLEAPKPKARTLLIGSHLDTVRNAGRFDGALGVVLPIVALAELRRRGVTLPFSVEVIGFSEEEGMRFPCAYIGSKGYTGGLRAYDLKVRDAAGVSLRSALEAFNQGSFALPQATHRARDVLGYLEVHLEQGPVLEKQGAAVGVVSGIAGQTRGCLTFRGHAGHAGTTPMNLRRDALAGAAEFVLFAEDHARSRPPLVATVGNVVVPNGTTNVIAGESSVTLDVRHPNDAHVRRAVAALVKSAQQIAKRRGLGCEWEQTMAHPATPCSAELTAELSQSVRAVQNRELSLVSGAGHDGVVMARVAPIAMLFVRCRDGLSHHPDEYVAPADLGVALRVVIDFIERLAAKTESKIT
jgi:allantoate deiminase